MPHGGEALEDDQMGVPCVNLSHRLANSARYRSRTPLRWNLGRTRGDSATAELSAEKRHSA